MIRISPTSTLTLATLAQRRPQFVDWGIRLDRAPAFVWLGLQALALAPTGIWMARALHAGPDALPGLLALVAIGFFIWRTRRELRASPRLGWLSLGACASLSVTVLHMGIAGWPAMPPWVAGLLAVCASVCSLKAFLPQRMALAPLAGLAVLALPLLPALKALAGPWLSIVQAEILRWMLLPAFHAVRDGGALLVDGRRLPAVAAAVDGVQLLWLGGFTACAVALWAGRRGHGFLARLPWVVLVLGLGSLIGDALGMAWSVAGMASADWMRQALWLLVPASTCGTCAALMAPSRRNSNPRQGGAHVACAV